MSTRGTDLHAARLEAETLIAGVGARFGFRARDFSFSWDGGEFDPARPEHQLVIVIGDGRRATVSISHEAIARTDAWKYAREIESAFAKLRRRAQSRGV